MDSLRIMAVVRGALSSAPRLPPSRHREIAVIICKDPTLTNAELDELGRIAGQFATYNISDATLVRMARQLVSKAREKTGQPPSHSLLSALARVIAGGFASPDEALTLALQVLEHGQDARILERVAQDISGNLRASAAHARVG